MTRWLLPVLGLGVALAAGWLLLTSPEGLRGPGAPPVAAPAPSARPAPNAKPAPAPPAEKPGKPMSQIDEASRRELEAVLEREGVGP